MDCEDQNFDHICDFCNLKLTKCEDSDKNHICDLCETNLNDCKDTNPADHICDICGETNTICIDLDNDHLCDVCLAELSMCEDLNQDHNCDLCDVVLSSCIDNAENYVCKICGAKLPYIIITAPDNCLVNDKSYDVQYRIGASIKVLFSYIGSDGRTVKEWIIVNSDGTELTKVKPNEVYVIDVSGEYYVTPVFE